MSPIDPWRNFTPDFGAVAFCTTNIEDFRTPLTSTSSTISSTYSSQKRSLRWTSSKRKIMELILVDQHEDTNNKRLSLAMPHSGIKPKHENDPKEEDDLNRRRPLTEDNFWQKPTFDRWHLLMEEDLWQKTTFDRRQPLTEDDLWQKTTFEGRRPLTEDDLRQKTTFDKRRPLTEDDF